MTVDSSKANTEREPNIEKKAIEWLARLQAPDLTAEQERAFFEWLEADEKHQKAYIEAESLWQRGEVIAQAANVSGNQDKATSVFSRAQYFEGWRVAAAIFLVVVVSVSYWQLQPAPKQAQWQSFATAIGEQNSWLLEDGSEVTLNTQSKIRIDFNSNVRAVYLDQGEAFFKVTHKPSHPFDVVTKAGRIRVLGTQFSVYQADKQTLVTVLEGKVGLDTKGSSPEQYTADATVAANQQLSFERAQKQLSPKKINANSELAWLKSQLIYRGESLQTVIDELNRYYPMQIQLDDSQLATQKVIAVIQLAELETTLATLENSLRLKAHVDEQKGTVILSAAEN